VLQISIELPKGARDRVRCLGREDVYGDAEGNEKTYMRPVECSSLEMRWGSLDHDIRMESNKRPLGVGTVDRGGLV
jgi:hypothetical protein